MYSHFNLIRQMIQTAYGVVTSVWLLLSIVGCTQSDPVAGGDFPPVRLNPADPPARRISRYYLFKDPKRQVPNDRVIPYDLNTPHFADYANLHRFIWLPEGKRIVYRRHELEFPVGAVIILTVGYLNDIRQPARGEQIIETRLLLRKEEGWIGLQYIWNKETTEAYLSLLGGEIEVSWVHYDGQKRQHLYLMPNRNQCNQCHQINGTITPLGPIQAQYLNKNFDYSEGTYNDAVGLAPANRWVENQLLHWSRIGYLDGMEEDLEQIPQVPVWNDPDTGTVKERARAYLDMNCANCHRPGGLAHTSGLDLTYKQQTPVRYGVFKAPVAAGRGAGNARFAIQPGRPEGSLLLHRLESIDPGVRMPIVGRSLEHREGVALISEWISQMTFPAMAELQSVMDQQKAAHFQGLKAIIESD